MQPIRSSLPQTIRNGKDQHAPWRDSDGGTHDELFHVFFSELIIIEQMTDDFSLKRSYQIAKHDTPKQLGQSIHFQGG